MSNLHKLLQGLDISSTCIRFLKTLLERLHKYGVFAGVALGTDNLYDFKLIVTLISNFMIKFFIQSMNTTVVEEKKGRSGPVPENISDLLTPRSVAYWFMDDGGCKSYKSKNRAYRFSTHSFPFEDQKRLIQALQDNFSIAATIQNERSHYRLYIRSSSTQRFLDLIRPYIHPCFDYKIQNSSGVATPPKAVGSDL